ncbi:CheR family methyltransferase [Bacillus alkalicellulosilyticus]|uniref:CheR family methyltransferase n=1 Tax=Alkalihalobacterium alkalicellulosilyticum TaxID=1912214 RepID=UPI001482FA41|nr:CheR family methyltransferase [Bacillus alkalicellulosilyticus]
MKTKLDSYTNKSTAKKGFSKVVGIGASAGSLEVLQKLFETISPTSGMSFIIVQHLSPNYKSHMKDLLSKRTTMDIHYTTDNMKVEPNCIYLIPPQKNVVLRNGFLELSDYVKKMPMNFPIDMFFTSLSEELGNNAVAVILSGKGWDGTKGIEAVYEAGGTVIVQNEKSAKFVDMPTNAIQSGKVDHVLGIHEISSLLNELSNPLYSKTYTSFKDDNTDEILEQICAIINRKSGVDFSSYKKNSIIRRIEKRINLGKLNFTSLHEYKEFLIGNPHEINLLKDDLLINVTEFFRDPKAFELVETKVIPEIVNQKINSGEKDIRIWVPGCSTGEEAYTIAMILSEYLDEIEESLNFKIFATDLDKDAIKKASTGTYSLHSVLGISQERMERFFRHDGDRYKVRHNIRDKIIFAPHNIAKDSPFVNLDFISCRNMLIYFQPDLQKKILSMFHFSLRTYGYLLLGPSESVNKLTNVFEPIDHKWKLFKNINGRNAQRNENENQRTSSNDVRDMSLPRYMEVSSYKRTDQVYKSLIEEYMDPFIIIDSQNDVVVTGGNINQFLRIPHGDMSNNILKMLPTNFSVAINTALKKARKEQGRVEYSRLKIKEGPYTEVINLIVEPFLKQNGDFIMVSFEPVKDIEENQLSEKAVSYDIDTNIQQLIFDLENELAFTKEHLQTTIEELETSNEEYQSTNEELIAANEELQSSNEELQSVNDELLNVNNEHETKIQQLIDLNNDIDNLLISTNLATVFLDEELKIKRFTPEITKIINLMDVDIGRPLSHISHNLAYQDLLVDAQHVLQQHKRLTKEVKSHNDKWYSLRIYPYRTMENFIKGVVITFVDITEMKKTNDELLVRSFAIEQSPANMIITNQEGIIEYVNAKFTEIVGYSKETVLGKPLQDMFRDDESKEIFQHSWEAVKRGEKWTGTSKIHDQEGNLKWEAVSFLPIINGDDTVTQYLRVSEDITEQKVTEDLLRKSEMLSALGELAAGIAHEIRNPLTALKGFIQLMQAEGDSNNSYLGIMLSEFNRIESIINELLVLARPHVVQYENTKICNVLNDVTMLLETQAIMNNVTIHSEFEPDLPLIQCVEKEIKQVIINLIRNSIEAMPDGGEITLKVRKEDYKNQIVITVIDQGKGIPEDRLDKIGQPFYTTKEKGTGLGLMVSYKIIENHKGLMQFSSELNKGTTVDITLPVLQ